MDPPLLQPTSSTIQATYGITFGKWTHPAILGKGKKNYIFIL